jgi:hypothetical protein
MSTANPQLFVRFSGGKQRNEERKGAHYSAYSAALIVGHVG